MPIAISQAASSDIPLLRAVWYAVLAAAKLALTVLAEILALLLPTAPCLLKPVNGSATLANSHANPSIALA